MSEQTNNTPQADDATLSDESLEAVSGGLSLIGNEPVILTVPPVMPIEPLVEPLVDPTILPVINL